MSHPAFAFDPLKPETIAPVPVLRGKIVSRGNFPLMTDRDPSHLYGRFAQVYEQILSDLQAYLDTHHTGMTCKMIEGLRSAAYQHSLWEQGRTKPGRIVTQRDGYARPSNHQSGLAADVGIFKSGGSVYIEEPPEDVNQYYGHLCRAHLMTWGGDWHSIVDKPHCEWPESDVSTYKAAHTWLKEQSLG